MDKIYNPKEVEDQIYQKWEASGYFNPDKLEEAHDRYWKAEVFSMVIPPPNATGQLHLGHALMLTIEDIMTRWARMTGKKTLWLPGTDHAAIATQNVVERQIWEKEKKTRHDLGREELLRRINEFVQKTRGQIQNQIKKMGASCDWSRERYTLQPELSLAVRTVFKQMYDAGLIYRGDRIVNWCLRCGTTLADDEVAYKETPSRLYYIKYPFAEGKSHLTIATTRPETMLADTAIAVNPQDSRYKKYLGKSVMLPVLNRELPIIADEHVDKTFGTGVLKVTPGHDPIDFEIGLKHELEVINLLTPEGKINPKEALDHGFESYAGLSVLKARTKIIKDLETQGFLEKTEEIKHNLGRCYRCEEVVEPIVSKQWFVEVNKKLKIKNKKFQGLLKLGEEASLKELTLLAVKSGAIKIIPERFSKIYYNWIKNLRDWNISRQIWFGHQIPVWYCSPSHSPESDRERKLGGEEGGGCGETIVAIEPPVKCPACGNPTLTQDPDTLDTWFSSSLWTFSTLGWPQETENLKTYHPTTILETGYDILFFWVARMILMTGFALNDIPFKTVYLHGLVRDIEGKKMSKSKGNIVNPIAMIEKYGADALRLALIIGTTPGNDLKLLETKIQSARNFINKFWNIARYILSQELSPPQATSYQPPALSLADQWILGGLDNLIGKVNKHLADYNYGLATEALYDFTWNKFADWYIEISKIKNQKSKLGENTNQILFHVLKELLKLWHPFIPFVTEQIWSQFSNELLMIEDYPLPPQLPASPAGGPATSYKLPADFEKIQSLITGLRNLRAEYRQNPGETLAVYLELSKNPDWVKEQKEIIETLAHVKLNFAAVPADKKMPYFIWQDAKIYLIISGFDPKKEMALTEKELRAVEQQITTLEGQLQKTAFLEKAPAAVVEKLKEDYIQVSSRRMKLQEKLKTL